MDDKTAFVEACRQPFEPAEIGHKPTIWCSACRQSSNRHCHEHQMVRCTGCHQRITEAHRHLDYVGHAVVTARLLDLDPDWDWQPLAFDEHGLPLRVPTTLTEGGRTHPAWEMWITLEIQGIKRLGVGTVRQDTRDPSKELIGDALRNAAMRFGVALDLWSREEITSPSAPSGATERASERPQRPSPPRDDQDAPNGSAEELKTALLALEGDTAAAARAALAEADLWPVGKLRGDQIPKAAQILAGVADDGSKEQER